MFLVSYHDHHDHPRHPHCPHYPHLQWSELVPVPVVYLSPPPAAGACVLLSSYRGELITIKGSEDQFLEKPSGTRPGARTGTRY